MKSIIVTGLAIAALTTSAFAQTASPQPAPPAPPAAQEKMAPPPHSAVPEVMSDATDAPPPPVPGCDAPPPPPPGPREMGREMGMGGHHRPPPPPSKAAHFRIEDGRTKIDVKCADDEPTKVCADTLMQIIEKMSGSSDRSNDDQY
ncbi:hypothetical protein [Rhizobium tumorigenes]|uniref:hypothetical protein n=1 Tax=Rhizobium tumorigenes TaxID=2041385 RepID=UPI00241F4000|nr:hypothetical protein [Rhizobium tumorigenes]WFS01543.1 hypothetical protein PR016_02590 [Rhizobium tumorigenes]